MGNLDVGDAFFEYRALAQEFIKDGDVSGFVEACENVREVLVSLGRERFGSKFMPSKRYNGFKAVELSPREDWRSHKISRAALHSLIQEYSPGSITYESRKQDAEKNQQIRKMYEEKEWADEFGRKTEELLEKNEVFSLPLESLSEEEWQLRFDSLMTKFFQKGDHSKTRHPTYFKGIKYCANRGNERGVRDLARICVEDSYALRRDIRIAINNLEKRGLAREEDYKTLAKAVQELGVWIELLEEESPFLECYLGLARTNGWKRKDE